MTLKHHGNTDDRTNDLSLLMATAGDLVAELSDLAASVERCLGRSTDVDQVISLLREKKAKVDTLNAVALEITSRLKSTAEGRAGLTIPGHLKVRFRELMAAFRRLLDRESRIEDLIAGRGFPVSRRLR
jgi:hypothetical protein